jgi:hypothetical protein
MNADTPEALKQGRFFMPFLKGGGRCALYGGKRP